MAVTTTVKNQSSYVDRTPNAGSSGRSANMTANDSTGSADPFLTESNNVLNRTSSSAVSINDARQHLMKAERSVKPTFMRWKPKHAIAGDEYCKAAILFYQAGEIEASKTNLLKACESFKKKKSWYSAAKALEQAMAITHKQNDLSTMTELAWRSAALFRKAGQPDSAAQLLERASKALEATQPDNATLMLEKAAETVETENRPIQAASYVSRMLKLALNNNEDQDEAIGRARKLVELYQEAGHKPSTGRAVLALIILLLDAWRTSEAEIVSREFGNNCTHEQNVIIEDLLDAFDQNDIKALEEARKNPVLVTSLGPEFSKVLDHVNLSEEAKLMGIKPRNRSRRKFSIIKLLNKDDNQNDHDNHPATEISTSLSSSSSDEDKKKRKHHKKKTLKKQENQEENNDGNEKNDDTTVENERTSPPASDLTSPNKEKKKDISEFKSKIPAASSASSHSKNRRNMLQKGKTTDIPSSAQRAADKMKRIKSQDPSAYIDVTSDSMDRHRPSNLPDPAAYMDVTGIDPIQPAYMGMTVEQWRAFKRSHGQDDQEYAFDDGIGDVGDDGGDW